ncbi:hypothetical protein C2S52_016057 [Perilla frutescens var. hirtella]|nr:hypothetical protein C2S52_016057 [Perilla frutescens var. hirtella]
MTPISKKKIELFLVLEEIMHQTVVFINLVMALLKENDAQTRRLEQHVRRYSMIDRIPNQVNHLRRLVNLGDADCVATLRMTRNEFSRLCYLMEHAGGLVNSKYVSVEEKVAMFLSILSHHKKNKIFKYNFMRSGQTVSKHIHVVLKALLRISSKLLVESAPISDDCTLSRWKWVKGSAADARVLRDAVNRTHRLKVPKASKKSDKTRRCWSKKEEEVLIACLKKIVASGWKTDNEFKVGYLNVLEQNMVKAFSWTDIRATPHICFKIHIWKRYYGIILSILTGHTGVGWNDSTKMIDANDDIWDAAIKDRATGEQAEDVMDAVNELFFSATKNKEKEVIVDIDLSPHDVNDEIKTDSTYQPVGNDTDKKNGGKKRKLADGSEGLYELLARKEVFEVVEKIGGLTLQEKLLVSKILVKNTENLELFSSLPEDARAEFVRMMLAGRL